MPWEPGPLSVPDGVHPRPCTGKSRPCQNYPCIPAHPLHKTYAEDYPSGADSLVAPLKGITHEQPVRAVLKYIDTAYIELKPHNLKDGVDGLAGVL